MTDKFPQKSSQNWHLDSAASHEGYNHAAPLAPLKDRDWLALIILFDRQDGDEIEAEVMSKLSLMVPEPSWDEDPFDFLGEFL
ncbi:hypothetical protein [Calothrix sp. PCC 6303]|uniref:hypothetical protein n=1 Tax=Calothrix sp. PCC 6303 TaxID=1170562 RepID=UPI0002A05203|nr:hypothetical protein [Calothrix sp. PCC 6303]AFZ03742.1 hypothetical protein Cal6303_4844 [Calothrix sp. PCC 6303]